MSNRWIIDRPQNFQSSISHWLFFDIISRLHKPYQIKNKETKTSLTIVTIPKLYLFVIFFPVGTLRWPRLSTRTQTLIDYSIESKTDNSTFRFWHFSYYPIDKFDLPFCFPVMAYIHWFSSWKFNEYVGIHIIVKNHQCKLLSPEIS